MARPGVLLGLLVAAIFCPAHSLDKYIEDTDRFPGWRGELPEHVDVPTSDTVGFGELGQELWRGKVEQISWSPRAFVYHNFLSDEECEHLKALAKKRLTKSTVVDNKTGKSVDSTVRTSSGTFLARGEDEVVKAIEKRISLVTMIPEENGEAIQILKYVDGQKYEPHTDYFHDKYNARPENGGQRVATVLMYLSTPEEGGETVFPYAEKKVGLCAHVCVCMVDSRWPFPGRRHLQRLHGRGREVRGMGSHGRVREEPRLHACQVPTQLRGVQPQQLESAQVGRAQGSAAVMMGRSYARVLFSTQLVSLVPSCSCLLFPLKLPTN